MNSQVQHLHASTCPSLIRLPSTCKLCGCDVLTGSKMRCCCCGGSVEYSGSTLIGPTLLPICCTSLVILRQASSISSSPVRNTNTSPAATAGSTAQHSRVMRHQLGMYNSRLPLLTTLCTKPAVPGAAGTCSPSRQGRPSQLVKAPCGRCFHNVCGFLTTEHDCCNSNHTPVVVSLLVSLLCMSRPACHAVCLTGWFTGVYLHHGAYGRLKVVTLRLLGVEDLHRVQTAWHLAT